MNLDISHTESRKYGASGYWPAIILFSVVFSACLLGIWSRPVGFLASVWPANALMLGILLRVPGAARASGWLAGIIAYMAADLLTGSSWLKASLLNAANLISIAAAYLILHRLPTDMIRLRQPSSILYIVLAALFGGAIAGVVGGAANPLLFGGNVLDGITFWWVSEVVNYVAILPIFLSAPSLRTLSKSMALRHWTFRKYDTLPALAVFISCVMTMIIGGPGAIAFPVLALLWCGLVYPVFLTAILTLLCSLLALVFISVEHFPDSSEHMALIELFSIRLGIVIIAIGPVMLSIVIRNHNELLAQVRYVATHDSLTGIDNRAAFREEAGRILKTVEYQHAIMMIDLDHFKSVNDAYGHAAGDTVLCETVRRISSCLRPGDRLGRMGGEEFAVILKNCQPEDATEVAERIRVVISQQPVLIDINTSLMVSASIGLAFADKHTRCLDALLSEADSALYMAKRNGRNRVEKMLSINSAVDH